MAEEGHNDQTKEYWTTIGGKRVYSHDMEALCRTVGYGWTLDKGKIVCVYCGIESYILSVPCECFGTKGDTGKRKEAVRRLLKIMSEQEAIKTPKAS